MRTPSSPDTHAWSDERVEQGVGTLLRVGVLVSAIVTLAGGTWYLLRAPFTSVGYQEFHGAPARLSSVAGIVAGVLALEPLALAQLGLVLLVATPIARVCWSLLGFIRQRDRMYVLITSIVLAILLLGLSGVGAHG